jgi:hypothetical protein
VRRSHFISALVLALPATAVEPPPEPPDPEFLEFLGETADMDPELVMFMESRAAQRAVKDAGKKAPEEDDDE